MTMDYLCVQTGLPSGPVIAIVTYWILLDVSEYLSTHDILTKVDHLINEVHFVCDVNIVIWAWNETHCFMLMSPVWTYWLTDIVWVQYSCWLAAVAQGELHFTGAAALIEAFHLRTNWCLHVTNQVQDNTLCSEKKTHIFFHISMSDM